MESVQPEAPVAESAEVVEEPALEEPAWNYQVGDTVYLDDTAFRVEQITDREVQLRDPSLPIRSSVPRIVKTLSVCSLRMRKTLR